MRALVAASVFVFAGCAHEEMQFATVHLPINMPPTWPSVPTPVSDVGSFQVVVVDASVASFDVQDCGVAVDGTTIAHSMTSPGEHRVEATLCHRAKGAGESWTGKITRDMHLVVGPLCHTEVYVRAFDRKSEPPDIQFTERVTCPSSYAWPGSLIPKSRTLPPVPTSDDDPSVRTWMNGAARFAGDQERYVTHARDVVRLNKDVVWLLCLEDKRAQLAVAHRAVLERIAALDKPGTDDALRRHQLTIVKVLYDRVTHLIAEAAQCV